MFSTKDILATIIRTTTFCQLTASLTLIFACERGQILLLTTGKQETDSTGKNILMNLLIMVGPVLLAIWYPQAGALAATLGSVGGLLVIYCVPTFTYLA
jgi:hypothetical protein